MTLFVCTGNTCRSPMAAALWRAMGHEAASAGLVAQEGAPASPLAVRTMKERGLDISAHRAVRVTEELLRGASRVFTMTERQAMELEWRYPRCADRIRALPEDIPDPFGGDAEDYRICAERLARALERLEEML